MLQLLWEKQSKFQKGTIESSVFQYSELFGCILCVYKEKTPQRNSQLKHITNIL